MLTDERAKAITGLKELLAAEALTPAEFQTLKRDLLRASRGQSELISSLTNLLKALLLPGAILALVLSFGDQIRVALAGLNELSIPNVISVKIRDRAESAGIGKLSQGFFDLSPKEIKTFLGLGYSTRPLVNVTRDGESLILDDDFAILEGLERRGYLMGDPETVGDFRKRWQTWQPRPVVRFASSRLGEENQSAAQPSDVFKAPYLTHSVAKAGLPVEASSRAKGFRIHLTEAGRKLYALLVDSIAASGRPMP